MTKDICSIDGCDRVAVARGWCHPHWKKWRRHGDPLRTPPTAQERFFTKVNKSGPVSGHAPHLGPCWLWTGGHGRYGVFSVGRQSIGAHRWSYEHHVGAIPANRQLDHLCRVTLCVNPMHLEAVTPSVNKRRAPSPERAKTHCPQGHAYDAENTAYDERGWRRCRACGRERARKRAQ